MKKTGAEVGEEPKGLMITITASESRRRCGMRFPKGQPVELAVTEFTEDEWKLIAADPVLNIAPPID